MREWDKRVEETRRIIKLRRVRDEADAEITRLRAERARRTTAKAIADAVAAEREACLRACRLVAGMDPLSEVRSADYLDGRRRGAELCADAIRARGTEGR